jgi:hypothetical protein
MLMKPEVIDDSPEKEEVANWHERWIRNKGPCPGLEPILIQKNEEVLEEVVKGDPFPTNMEEDPGSEKECLAVTTVGTMEGGHAQHQRKEECTHYPNEGNKVYECGINEQGPSPGTFQETY